MLIAVRRVEVISYFHPHLLTREKQRIPITLLFDHGTIEGVSVLVGVHPVREALKAGRSIDRVLIAKGAGGTRVQEIVDLCRERKIPVRFEDRSALDRAASGETHQGIVALARKPVCRTLGGR